MAAPKRSKVQREYDLTRIAELYLTGHTQAEIANVIGLTQQIVSRDLATIQQRWEEQSTIALDAAKRRELARIDELERTYWEAWRRSLEQVTKTKTKRNHMGDEAIVIREETSGNPAFLAGVQNCIDQRCKLLGLYAPAKAVVSGDKDNPVQHAINYIREVRPPVASGPAEPKSDADEGNG
ncbi:MAG: hypothetical protein IT328_20095 [Caldilineaceae bacterium]|nr:hypothetical protein [Caldilineaceae bacterium]